ncbi:GNAT family N-acetyltransferase [Arthrobacter echini]|uniref:GNAT family N-acetyltransferase n=2 Tax=Arthrobacter echini TaxID=1529066 RepID=A0A4V6S865_9MICC|nr:GNAT family N-acetyltransferase [Arthrobacter echini]
MELEAGTISIIRFAWARLLGLGDGALDDGGTDRLYRTDDDAGLLTFVTLFGREILSGPGWAVDAARALPGTELRDHSTLLTLSREHGGRGLGEAQLYFCDVLPEFEGPPAVVTSDAALVRALEQRCPPDDVAEAGLGTVEHAVVLVAGDTDEDDASPLPLAGAGYDVWEGILAHTAVLTPPEERRKGYAQAVTAVAIEEAMAAGLVPQWRARTDNTASQRTARRAGFAYAGTQTSVALDRT